MASAGHWCMLVCVACLVLLIQESVAPRVHSSRKGSIRRLRPFRVQVQQAKPDSGSEGSSQTSTTTKFTSSSTLMSSSTESSVGTTTTTNTTTGTGNTSAEEPTGTSTPTSSVTATSSTQRTSGITGIGETESSIPPTQTLTPTEFSATGSTSSGTNTETQGSAATGSSSTSSGGGNFTKETAATTASSGNLSQTTGDTAETATNRSGTSAASRPSTAPAPNVVPYRAQHLGDSGAAGDQAGEIQTSSTTTTTTATISITGTENSTFAINTSTTWTTSASTTASQTMENVTVNTGKTGSFTSSAGATMGMTTGGRAGQETTSAQRAAGSKSNTEATTPSTTSASGVPTVFPPTSTGGSDRCPGFVMIDDYCYATVSATFSWLSAADVCKSLHKDADLVVVSSADKQEAVKALVANLDQNVCTAAWTSGHRLSTDNKSSLFVWKRDTTDTQIWNLPSDLLNEITDSSKGGCLQIQIHDGTCGWRVEDCAAKACVICELRPQAEVETETAE